jgi:hypothetical protein
MRSFKMVGVQYCYERLGTACLSEPLCDLRVLSPAHSKLAQTQLVYHMLSNEALEQGFGLPGSPRLG